jgi:hypothetical protein
VGWEGNGKYHSREVRVLFKTAKRDNFGRVNLAEISRLRRIIGYVGVKIGVLREGAMEELGWRGGEEVEKRCYRR